MDFKVVEPVNQHTVAEINKNYMFNETFKASSFLLIDCSKIISPISIDNSK